MTRRTMNATVSRRALLAGIAGTGAVLASPRMALAHEQRANPIFPHGVASGDPDATGVVLWTHVVGDGEVSVDWEISSAPDFEEIVTSGTLVTGPERDHTVKVLAKGLRPGGGYFYRFRSGGIASMTGRCRTLPGGHIDSLGIALASCSNYAFGFFNAYDAIASDAGVDFVLHTGDYIYEYGADGWGGDIAKAIGRVHVPAHEITSLADYRQRHAQYKTDAGSQAMHAAHTLICCWDDHESANNPWSGGAQNHQSETEGAWRARRNNSVRAYFEWMPVREPEWLEAKGRERAQFWRSYSFGDLATLVTLETRHTARAKQIDYMNWTDKIRTDADAEKFRRGVLGEPGRQMLSPEMKRDLAASLSRSVEEGQPWRLIGNPMPIAKTIVPDVVKLGLFPDMLSRHMDHGKLDATAAMAEAGADLAWKGKWALPFYPDTWDGYPWAREELYKLSRRAGAADLIFLTGDSHSFWANRLSDDQGRPAGIEIGTSGISSPGDFVARGYPPSLCRKLDEAFAQHVDEVVWTDNMHQGYVRVTLERERGAVAYIAVSTVLSTDYFTEIVRKTAFRRENEHVEFY